MCARRCEDAQRRSIVSSRAQLLRSEGRAIGAASLLLQLVANLNLQNSLHHTPLHMACQRSQDVAIQALVAAGARLLVADLRGKMCFELPAQMELREVVRVVGVLQRSVQDQLRSKTPHYTSADLESIDQYAARKTLQLLEHDNDAARKKAADAALTAATNTVAATALAVAKPTVGEAGDKSHRSHGRGRSIDHGSSSSAAAAAAATAAAGLSSPPRLRSTITTATDRPLSRSKRSSLVSSTAATASAPLALASRVSPAAATAASSRPPEPLLASSIGQPVHLSQCE